MFAEHPARPLLRQVYTMNAIHECYGLGKLEEFVNDETPALTAESYRASYFASLVTTRARSSSRAKRNSPRKKSSATRTATF